MKDPQGEERLSLEPTHPDEFNCIGEGMAYYVDCRGYDKPGVCRELKEDQSSTPDTERLINLSYIDLRYNDLSYRKLSKTNLYQAKLIQTKLCHADLTDANLSKAMLNNADLSYADLSKADLSGATLFGADLSKANLSGADLNKADLSKANLSDADLSEVHHLKKVRSLDHTDLRGVKGLAKKQLEACKAKGANIDEDSTNIIRA